MVQRKEQTGFGILTVQLIEIAQKYYDLLKKVVWREDELKISESVH